MSRFILNTLGGDTHKFYKRGYAESAGGPPLDYPVEYTFVYVTSRSTQIMTETGEENDIDLFNSPVPKAETE